MHNVSSTANGSWHVLNKQPLLTTLENKHAITHSQTDIPLLLSSLSSLIVDFGDGGV